MSYNYQTHRVYLFTEEGQVFFLKVRDAVKRLIEQAGAFRFDKISLNCGYSSWDLIAAVDRLVELGELEELPRPSWQQYKVYSTPEKHNL